MYRYGSGNGYRSHFLHPTFTNDYVPLSTTLLACSRTHTGSFTASWFEITVSTPLHSVEHTLLVNSDMLGFGGQRQITYQS